VGLASFHFSFFLPMLFSPRIEANGEKIFRLETIVSEMAEKVQLLILYLYFQLKIWPVSRSGPRACMTNLLKLLTASLKTVSEKY
jgi:hypothetical protein